MTTENLLVNMLLYVFLPFWVVAGFIDWVCHRQAKIEHTSGLRESIMHCVMGVQVAIPMVLCLFFEINILVLLICLLAWLAHEWVAHMDIVFAAPRRKISVLEMHAHSYLATLPFYMLSVIAVLNWAVVQQLLSFQWGDGLRLLPLSAPQGGENYVLHYFTFMLFVGVFPYVEELLRCLRAPATRTKI